MQDVRDLSPCDVEAPVRGRGLGKRATDLTASLLKARRESTPRVAASPRDQPREAPRRSRW